MSSPRRKKWEVPPSNLPQLITCQVIPELRSRFLHYVQDTEFQLPKKVLEDATAALRETFGASNSLIDLQLGVELSCYANDVPLPVSRDRTAYTINEDEFDRFTTAYLEEFKTIAVDNSLPCLRPIASLAEYASLIISQAVLNNDIPRAVRLANFLVNKINSQREIQQYLTENDNHGYKMLEEEIRYRLESLHLYDYNTRNIQCHQLFM